MPVEFRRKKVRGACADEFHAPKRGHISRPRAGWQMAGNGVPPERATAPARVRRGRSVLVAVASRAPASRVTVERA